MGRESVAVRIEDRNKTWEQGNSTVAPEDIFGLNRTCSEEANRRGRNSNPSR